VLAGGIVRVCLGLAGGIRELREQAVGVLQVEERAARMSQLREQTAGVGGGDAVAVGVLDVVQRAVGIEVGDGAIDFAQLVAAAAQDRQHGVVAHTGQEAAVLLLGEIAQGAARVDGDVALGIGAGGNIPVADPAAAQGPSPFRPDTDWRNWRSKTRGIPGAGRLASKLLASVAAVKASLAFWVSKANSD